MAAAALMEENLVIEVLIEAEENKKPRADGSKGPSAAEIAMYRSKLDCCE